MTLLMSFNDFATVQQLPAEALRVRFDLPAACDPIVTALTTDTSMNQVSVAIECRAKPADVPPAPATRLPSGRPTRKP